MINKILIANRGEIGIFPRGSWHDFEQNTYSAGVWSAIQKLVNLTPGRFVAKAWRGRGYDGQAFNPQET